MSELATYIAIANVPGVSVTNNEGNWYKYPTMSSIQSNTNAEVGWGYQQTQLVQLEDISGPSSGLMTTEWAYALGTVDVNYIEINGYFLTQLSYTSWWGATWEIASGSMGYGPIEVYVSTTQGNVNYFTGSDSNNANFAYQLLAYGWNTINSYGTWLANSNAIIYIAQ